MLLFCSRGKWSEWTWSWGKHVASPGWPYTFALWPLTFGGEKDYDNRFTTAFLPWPVRPASVSLHRNGIALPTTRKIRWHHIHQILSKKNWHHAVPKRVHNKHVNQLFPAPNTIIVHPTPHLTPLQCFPGKNPPPMPSPSPSSVTAYIMKPPAQRSPSDSHNPRYLLPSLRTPHPPAARRCATRPSA